MLRPVSFLLHTPCFGQALILFARLGIQSPFSCLSRNGASFGLFRLFNSFCQSHFLPQPAQRHVFSPAPFSSFALLCALLLPSVC